MNAYHPNTATGLHATRRRLGLSQAKLAELLNVSRSTISMTEAGQRSLPTESLIKLAGLEIQIAGFTSTQDDSRQHPSELLKGEGFDHSPAAMEFKKAVCNYRAYALTEKLEFMSARYKDLRSNLDVIEKLINGFEEMTGSEGDQQAYYRLAFLKNERHMIIQKLSKCSLQAQAVLRNKIALYHAEYNLSESVRQHFGTTNL